LHTWGEREGEKINLNDTLESEENSTNSTSSSAVSTPKSEKSNTGSRASSPKSSSSAIASTPAIISNPPPSTLTILHPSEPVIIPTQDINIEIERRSRSAYGFPTMVTSTAHCWFNTYFEGEGPERQGEPKSEGTFEIEWDAMDGLKGSSRRGVRAVEKIAVVWMAIDDQQAEEEQKQAAVAKAQKGEKVEDTADDHPDPVEEGKTSKIMGVEEAGESDVEDAVQSYGVQGEKI
jgi:hypothetical protein